MTAEEFDRACTALGYVSTEVRAAALRVSRRSVERYQEGGPIPRIVDRLLEEIARTRELDARLRFRAIRLTVSETHAGAGV